MNLSGSLDAFALPDVLTMLAATGKSGRLRLQAGAGAQERTARIDLIDGRVTAAFADEHRSGRLRRLSGFGDDAFWRDLSGVDDEDALVARLLEAGWLEATEIARIGRDATIDAVTDLLHWEQGQFEFVVGPTLERFTELTVADMLVEAGRGQVRPDLGPSAPGVDDVLALPLTSPADVEVSREEWALLALIDGARTTREVADLRGRDLDAVRAGLAALVDRELVVVCVNGRTPVAGLHNRLREITAIERGVPAPPPARPAPRNGVADRPAKEPAVVVDDGDWTPTHDLVDLAVPVDRDAVMRLIVGVQGL